MLYQSHCILLCFILNSMALMHDNHPYFNIINIRYLIYFSNRSYFMMIYIWSYRKINIFQIYISCVNPIYFILSNSQIIIMILNIYAMAIFINCQNEDICINNVNINIRKIDDKFHYHNRPCDIIDVTNCVLISKRNINIFYHVFNTNNIYVSYVCKIFYVSHILTHLFNKWPIHIYLWHYKLHSRETIDNKSSLI